MKREYNWIKSEDEYGNFVGLLRAPYTDETFYFRIKQTIGWTSLIWYSDSDPELGGDMNGETWNTFQEAKEAIQKCYDTCLETSEDA